MSDPSGDDPYEFHPEHGEGHSRKFGDIFRKVGPREWETPCRRSFPSRRAGDSRHQLIQVVEHFAKGSDVMLH